MATKGCMYTVDVKADTVYFFVSDYLLISINQSIYFVQFTLSDRQKPTKTNKK